MPRKVLLVVLGSNQLSIMPICPLAIMKPRREVLYLMFRYIIPKRLSQIAPWPLEPFAVVQVVETAMRLLVAQCGMAVDDRRQAL
jgi:hypothetical protein